MQKRIAAGLAALAAGLVLTLIDPAPVAAQKDKEAKAPDKGPVPKFLYGHDLKVRPGGKADFVDAIRIGVEVFEDDNTKSIVAISESGALSVIKSVKVGSERTCKWLTAHDLSTRKADEPEFTQKTKKHGVEVFRDQGSNHLLYACETASIAFAPIPSGLVTDKGPKWHHALVPKVRAPEQQSFDNAKKFGMEVFKDENTGGLMYITETGSLATGPAPATAPDKNKIVPPKTVYGLVLRVRGADEADFTAKTKRFGVEVFQDPNAGDILFYISEAGSVATAPKPEALADIPEGTSAVVWKSAMVLKARKGGETDFEKAKRYGIEVFQDNRTGNLIFISDTGSIAVLPK